MNQGALDIEPPTLCVDGGEGIVLDVAALLASRLVIQGSSRSGKSYLLRYILEGAAARMPIVVIDWEGEYHTLKEIAEFVWLGSLEEGADLALRPASARRLCRDVVGAGASVIVDVSEIDVEDRYAVVAAVLDELMHLPKAARRARLVAIDEAHELAPQGGDVPSSAAVRAIASRGGKRGLALIAVTQRLSRLDKSVAEAMNWIVGRTVLDVDLRRAADQLGFDRAQARDLRGLRRGQFYAFGPAIGDGSVQLVRSGAVVSSHPDGARLTPPPGAAELAEALRAVREAPDELDEDRAGRTELLEEIARLRTAIADAKAGNVSDPADIRRAVKQATSPLNDQLRALRLLNERAKNHARMILLDAGELPEEKRDGETGDSGLDENQRTLAATDPRPEVLPIEAGSQRGDGDRCDDHGDSGTGARDTVSDGLDPRAAALALPFAAAIVKHLAGQKSPVHRQALADRVGSRPTSSTFRRALSYLRAAGVITYPSDGMVAIEEAARV